jgi:hypothetical protein
MAFQLSPGINVSEIDLTTVIPSVATTTGAFVGPFAWGPAGEVTTISDEVRLASTFGKPNSDNYEYWFSAANFLAYGNNLKVVRAVDTAAATRSNNATANGTTVLIRNQDDWTANQQGNADGSFGGWAARYPGELGNSLGVSVADGNTYTGWAYASQFTATPNTSSYVFNKSGVTSNDELHIVVIDENGLFSGTAGTVLEKYAFVSKASDAKDDSGNSNYYKNVIAAQSQYIHWLAHPPTAYLTANGTAWGSTANASIFKTLTANVTALFANGADGTIATSQLITGWNLFRNSEAVDISLCITGSGNQSLSNHVIENIAEARKDCIVFVSPTKASVVNNVGNEASAAVTYRNTITTSSYAVIDSGYKVSV